MNPSPRIIAFEAACKVMLHVGPIGIIQFTDYVTDLLVRYKFFQDGNYESGWGGVGCVLASITLSWCVLSCLIPSRSAVGIVWLLAPLNLHTLFLGWANASLNAELAIHKSKAMRLPSFREKMKMYQETARASGEKRAQEIHSRKSVPGIDAAASRQEHEEDKEFFSYLDLKRESKELYTAFVVSKAIESGVESLPLAILTAAHFFSNVLDGQELAVYGSSLALSVLSMAYAYLSLCTERYNAEATGKGEVSLASGDCVAYNPIDGRKSMIFVTLAVNVAWTLTAIGMCYGTSSLAPANYVLIFLPVAIQWLSGNVIFAHVWKTEGGGSFIQTNCIGNSVMVVCWAIISLFFAFETVGVDVFHLISPPSDPLAARRTFREDFESNAESRGGIRKETLIPPILRRISLLAISIAAVSAQFTSFRATVVVFGTLIDLLLSTWMFLALFQILDRGKLASREEGMGPTAHHRRQTSGAGGPLLPTDNRESGARLAGEAREDEQRGGGVPHLSTDMLKAISLHASNALARMEGGSGGSGGPGGPGRCQKALQGLQARAEELLQQEETGGKQAKEDDDRLSLGKAGFVSRGEACVPGGGLSFLERRVIEAAVEAYVPSEDGSAESRLLEALLRLSPLGSKAGDAEGNARSSDVWGLQQPVSEDTRAAVASESAMVSDGMGLGAVAGMEGTIPIKASEDSGAAATEQITLYTQPVHAVRLRHALQESTWTTVPSFFGARAEGTAFELSFQSSQCSYFISHSWKDDGKKKVEMLREFLSVQVFVGRLLVCLPLLAAFLLPLGFALHSLNSQFHAWVLPCAVLGMMGVLLLWVALSVLGLGPSRYTPWTLSSTTVWIDKLCIDQTSDQTKQAGVASFPVVLDTCDGMVALISENYFSRIWCVYELAMFSRDKPEALLLFSLDWPSSLNPLKSNKLTAKEVQMLQEFSCEKAECYVPKDRVTVLRAIRDKFGSEENFNTYVREVLPGVLHQSKQEYCTQLSTVAADAFSLAFGG